MGLFKITCRRVFARELLPCLKLGGRIAILPPKTPNRDSYSNYVVGLTVNLARELLLDIYCDSINFT